MDVRGNGSGAKTIEVRDSIFQYVVVRRPFYTHKLKEIENIQKKTKIWAVEKSDPQLVLYPMYLHNIYAGP